MLYVANVQFPISTDAAIQRELRHDASTADLDTRITDALAKDDVETADMYAEIAAYMHRPLSPAVEKKLADAHSTMATITRNTKDFATGFVTGSGTSTAGLAGAVTSDSQSSAMCATSASRARRWSAGEDYSKLVLGLSIVGLAATVATVATGGGGIVAKTGVSILKAAKRAGTLTADFARRLTRIVERRRRFPRDRTHRQDHRSHRSARNREGLRRHAHARSRPRRSFPCSDASARSAKTPDRQRPCG